MVFLQATADISNIGFSDSATKSGVLTAGVQAVLGYDTSDTAEVDVVVTSGPAWVVKLSETAPTASTRTAAPRPSGSSPRPSRRTCRRRRWPRTASATFSAPV